MRIALAIFVLCSLSCGGETEPVSTVVPPPVPIPPPDPEPEPPATPTGLMVSGTTETSITWTWDPVEGATAYAVQISMNAMFGDEDDVTTVSLMPTYTVADVPPSTTVHFRVAAATATPLEDGEMSAWTTPVTGTSDMPPPPPPAPIPGHCERSTGDRPDDFSGPQIHIVYAIASDGRDYGLDTRCEIVEMIRTVQEFLRSKTGQEFRIDTYRGSPDVTFAQFSGYSEADLVSRRNGRSVADTHRIMNALDSEIGTSPERVYGVLYTYQRRIAGASLSNGIANQDLGVAIVPLQSGLNPFEFQTEAYLVHEIFHVMGAVPTCAPNYDRLNPPHVLTSESGRRDIMIAGGRWPPGGEPYSAAETYVDFGRDDYYGHGRSDCPDISRSPYFRRVAAPPAPPSSPSVRGFLTETVEGGPVAGATLRASGVTARSAADGSFALALPAGEHRLTVSGPGVVERTTTVRAPQEALALDVIPEDGPWTLDFYREIARNGAGGGELEPLLPWDAEPTFFIDTRPEPTTGAEIPAETIEYVKEAIRVTVPLLSGGRYAGERIETTSEPPADMTPGTVVLRWNTEEVSAFAETADAFAYRVGGAANVVVFRHIPETWAVYHEIGHVMGLYHPLGGHRPSHMWYSGELEPPHFTEWDIFHARVLYSRPAGNTDVDVDPAGFLLPRAAARETAVKPVVCSFPDALPPHD